MNLESARVILTGASGRIGSATALALAQSRAQLLLVDRQAEGVQRLAQHLRADGAQAQAYPADLTAAPIARRRSSTRNACSGASTS